jgi:hypothetical protein
MWVAKKLQLRTQFDSTQLNSRASCKYHVEPERADAKVAFQAGSGDRVLEMSYSVTTYLPSETNFTPSEPGYMIAYRCRLEESSSRISKHIKGREASS